jgi:hypothetical protein
MAVGVFGTALDVIPFAGIDQTNDMLTVCDANGDDLGTGPEDKRIAAREFIKRTLGGSDTSWMTALANLAAIDAAADKFVIWDNSASAWKPIVVSELMNYTLGGTSIAGLSALATLSLIDSSTDKFVVWDASATAWKVVPASQILSALQTYTTTDYTATPTTVTTALSGQRLTNRGATQVIEFDLPAATVGQRYSFNRIAGYAVRLDPNGSETISDGGAGKYLEIQYRGQVDIECFSTGEWEVTGGSGLYAMEA